MPICAAAANLARVYVLVDARHGLKATDTRRSTLLGQAAVSHQIVLTKCDELKPAELDGRISRGRSGARQAPCRLSRPCSRLHPATAPAFPNCARRSRGCWRKERADASRKACPQRRSGTGFRKRSCEGKTHCGAYALSARTASPKRGRGDEQSPQDRPARAGPHPVRGAAAHAAL